MNTWSFMVKSCRSQVYVVRAFVELRGVLSTNKELATRLPRFQPVSVLRFHLNQ